EGLGVRSPGREAGSPEALTPSSRSDTVLAVSCEAWRIYASDRSRDRRLGAGHPPGRLVFRAIKRVDRPERGCCASPVREASGALADDSRSHPHRIGAASTHRALAVFVHGRESPDKADSGRTISVA